MSPAGFAFKGSGFYLTDYGKNAHRGTDPAAGCVGPVLVHRRSHQRHEAGRQGRDQGDSKATPRVTRPAEARGCRRRRQAGRAQAPAKSEPASPKKSKGSERRCRSRCARRWRAPRYAGAPADIAPLLERSTDPAFGRLGDEPRHGARQTTGAKAT